MTTAQRIASEMGISTKDANAILTGIEVETDLFAAPYMRAGDDDLCNSCLHEVWRHEDGVHEDCEWGDA